MSFNLQASESYYSKGIDDDYMTDELLRYFRDKLLNLRDVMIRKANEAQILKEETEYSRQVEDFIDQGHNEELQQRSYVFQRHDTQLLNEVSAALTRIEDGSYGYCEETGNPIGLKRLEAMPQARYCIQVQERKERSNRFGAAFREDVGQQYRT